MYDDNNQAVKTAQMNQTEFMELEMTEVVGDQPGVVPFNFPPNAEPERDGPTSFEKHLGKDVFVYTPAHHQSRDVGDEGFTLEELPPHQQNEMAPVFNLYSGTVPGEGDGVLSAEDMSAAVADGVVTFRYDGEGGFKPDVDLDNIPWQRISTFLATDNGVGETDDIHAGNFVDSMELLMGGTIAGVVFDDLDVALLNELHGELTSVDGHDGASAVELALLLQSEDYSLEELLPPGPEYRRDRVSDNNPRETPPSAGEAPFGATALPFSFPMVETPPASETPFGATALPFSLPMVETPPASETPFEATRLPFSLPMAETPPASETPFEDAGLPSDLDEDLDLFSLPGSEASTSGAST